MTGERLLAELAGGQAPDLPIAVIAAHPDDETLGAATLMRRARDLVLIHLTDGAPLDGRDAMRAGFPEPDAYALARRLELDEALGVMGVRPRLRVRYDLPDQQTVFHIPELTALLREDLAGCAAVITHAYEGGHPDHDTAALAVQIACEGAGQLRLEFAGYHASGGALRRGCFPPLYETPEQTVRAASADRRARAEALACFATQADTLAQLGFEAERLRLAPVYDFTYPPGLGEALYDQWDLGLSSRAWRAVAAVYGAAALAHA